MSTRILCPACKSSLKTANEPARGAKLKCPKCQQVFRYEPPASSPVPTTAAPQAPPEPAADRGSRWPVLIALACLVLVVCGTLYVMRGSIAELLAKNSGKRQSGETTRGDKETEGREQSGTKSETSPSTTPNTSTVRAPGESAAKKTLQLPAVFNGGTPFSQIVLSSDQATMAATDAQSIQIWDLATEKKVKTLPYSPGYDLRLIFSPDGQVLAAISRNGNQWAAKLWLLPQATEIASFEWEENDDDSEAVFTYESYEATIAFSPSSERFAVPGDNHVIIVWDLTRAKQLSRLTGHDGRIDDLVFTSDSKNLISVCADSDHKSVRLWSVESGKGQELTSDQWIYQCLLTADNKTLITRGVDRISVWNLASNGMVQLNHSIDQFSSKRVELWPDDNTLLIVSKMSSDGALAFVLWDLKAQKVLKQIESSSGSTEDVKQARFSPDRKTIGTITRDGLELYDAGTGQLRAKYDHVLDRSEYVSTFDFDYRGDLLVISMSNGQVRLESTSGGAAGASIVSEPLATLTPDVQPIDVIFSENGKSVVTLLRPKPVDPQDPAILGVLREAKKKYVEESAKWTAASTSQRAALEVEFYVKNVTSKLQPIADQQQWAAIAAVWNLSSPAKPQRVIRQPLLNAPDIEPLTKDRPLRASGDVYAQDLIDPMFGLVNSNRRFPLCAVGGNELVWLNRLEGFQLAPLATGQDITIAQSPSDLEAWQLSPRGNILAAVMRGNNQNDDKGRLVLVDIEHGVEKLSLPLSTYNRPEQRNLCFSPDGVTFATVLHDESNRDEPYIVKVWDTETGREPNPPLNVRLAAVPEYLQFSPDGTYLTFPHNYGPQIIDVIGGRKRATTVTDTVYLPTFSPDSKTFAFIAEFMAGGTKNNIHLLDVSNGQLAKKVSGFATNVHSLAFSPNGKLLAAGGGNVSDSVGSAKHLEPYGTEYTSELKLFDATSGDLLAVLGGHKNLVTHVTFTSDGDKLASLSWDGTVKIWNVADVLGAANNKPSSSGRARPPLAKIQLPKKSASSSAEGSSTSASGIDFEPGSTITTQMGMYLVVIPAGKFRQGSPNNDRTAEANEKPQREIQITRPFAMGMYEVTVGQFRQFVNFANYHTDAENSGGGTGYDANTGELLHEPREDFNWDNIGVEQTDDHPVVNVSWNDAQAFCEWMSQAEGATFRLPTEAEWEYACRAGTTTRYWTGNDDASLEGNENIGDAALKETWSGAETVQSWNDGFAFTAPVANFPMNPFGLYDMHGNANEWTSDWYSANAYRDKVTSDPQGPASGKTHVIRGGSWFNESRHARAAFRWGETAPGSCGADTGFRVVRELVD